MAPTTKGTIQAENWINGAGETYQWIGAIIGVLIFIAGIPGSPLSNSFTEMIILFVSGVMIVGHGMLMGSGMKLAAGISATLREIAGK